MKLALDTSTLNTSLALFGPQNQLIDKTEHFEEKYQQSKILFGLLDQLLKRNHVSPASVSSLAIGIGPGSYTGLRVGLAFAKTWVFAQHVELRSFRSTTVHDESKLARVENLKWSETDLVSDANQLSPIYENDHFA